MHPYSAVLFHLCTGSTLFHVARDEGNDDGLTEEDKDAVCEWNEGALEKRLKAVKGNNAAKKLLKKLLQADPDERPDNFKEVLDDEFFKSASDNNNLELIVKKLDKTEANVIEHVKDVGRGVKELGEQLKSNFSTMKNFFINMQDRRAHLLLHPPRGNNKGGAG